MTTMAKSRERAERDLLDGQVRLEDFIQTEHLHEAARSDLLWKIEKNRSLISEFERQLQKLDIGQEGKRAWLGAIEDKIAEISQQAATVGQAENDIIIAQLQRIVEIRKEEIARRQNAAEGGRGTASEVRQAQAELAKAEIELARRRQDLLRAGTDLELLARSAPN